MATSSASHRPIKGILKNKSSTTSSVVASAQQPGGAMEGVMRKKSQKWDESSILATYRPGYKDYDLMKVNEPSNPCLNTPDEGEDTVCNSETKECMTPESLAKKLAAIKTWDPRRRVEEQESIGEEEWKILREKQEKQRQFEMKRKLHYNEGRNIKLARQLISLDLEAEEEKNENEECWHETNEENTTTEESEEGIASEELQAKSCDS
ncbi:protein phosphatase inhibitor 2 family member C [Loxodonta africana]|uniref:PPP1R2 family member C n=1 Tax=Loxodonta africana TaxID=9785 RepID=G3UKJ2_LOXAF|nr:protein phosphatase inhibitor 2 family member C [Elephas maximus indicus]